MWGRLQKSLPKWSFNRSYVLFLQRDAWQSSLSRIRLGIESLLRHAEVARPAGPAPTITTGTSISMTQIMVLGLDWNWFVWVFTFCYASAFISLCNSWHYLFGHFWWVATLPTMSVINPVLVFLFYYHSIFWSIESIGKFKKSNIINIFSYFFQK